MLEESRTFLFWKIDCSYGVHICMQLPFQCKCNDAQGVGSETFFGLYYDSALKRCDIYIMAIKDSGSNVALGRTTFCCEAQADLNDSDFQQLAVITISIQILTALVKLCTGKTIYFPYECQSNMVAHFCDGRSFFHFIFLFNQGYRNRTYG